MVVKFRDEIDAACDAALAAFGFHSPRRGNPLIALNDGFYGWVGLNRSGSGESVRIDPFIGLHCVPVMKLFYELDTVRKKKYVLGSTATAAVHMGELAPDVNAFFFSRSEPLEREAQRLAAAVVEFGLPWMKANASLDALLPLLREREEMLGGFPERVAVVLHLLGRHDELSRYVEARREDYARNPKAGSILEAWTRFAEGLTRLQRVTSAVS